MSSDPYVSAVVTLRPDDQKRDDDATVADPERVASEAAAVLEGGAPAPNIAARRNARPADIAVPKGGGSTAQIKGYFTNAAFEVHAPLGAVFSIGAPRSRFESFFGQSLVIEEGRLGSPVTTEDGGRELPTEELPAEVRTAVESIMLPEPPDFPPGIG
jgi:hypothetical protein